MHERARRFAYGEHFAHRARAACHTLIALGEQREAVRQARLAGRRAMQERMHDRALFSGKRRFRGRRMHAVALVFAPVFAMTGAVIPAVAFMLRRRRLRLFTATEWPP